MEQNPQKVIVGLGNPGAEFENTYHNAGILALEYLARMDPGAAVAESSDWKTYKKLFSYLEHGTEILVRPLTFMNESGMAVKDALKKFNAAPKDLFVLHDESDLSIGTFRISHSRNPAGHNGVRSIIDHLGTKEFTRVRIGIRPVNEVVRQKASAFVLSRITKSDRAALEDVFKKISGEILK